MIRCWHLLKHVTYCTSWQWIRCNLWRARIWLVTSSFCRGNNLMVGAWPDPSSLCEGCCLQDYEYLALPHTHAHEHIIMLMGLFKINHMISLVPRLVPAYARAWKWGYHETQNCSLVARECSAFHHFQYILHGRNKMQRESKAIQILHKIQYQQYYSGVLLISHTNEEFWSWTARRSLQTL